MVPPSRTVTGSAPEEAVALAPGRITGIGRAGMSRPGRHRLVEMVRLRRANPVQVVHGPAVHPGVRPPAARAQPAPAPAAEPETGPAPAADTAPTGREQTDPAATTHPPTEPATTPPATDPPPASDPAPAAPVIHGPETRRQAVGGRGDRVSKAAGPTHRVPGVPRLLAEARTVERAQGGPGPVPVRERRSVGLRRPPGSPPSPPRQGSVRPGLRRSRRRSPERNLPRRSGPNLSL
jgi:hypothetical protein